MPSPGRRDRRLSLGPQARPDLRALLGRARGREPLRPRPAAPDLHLPLGGPGRRGTARTTAGWSTCWTTTSRRASTPSGFEVLATHTMRVKLLSPTSTLRLRLHDDFRVASVSSDEGGSLLFFRVREQGNLVVSLGAARPAGASPSRSTTRYCGPPRPRPGRPGAAAGRGALRRATSPTTRSWSRPPLVYSNRTAWYPRPPERGLRDRAGGARHARRAGSAVTGGELVSLPTEGGRTRAEYRLDAARQVRDGDRGPARRRGPAAGGRAGAARLRGPAHARRDPGADAGRPGDAGLLRREVRPVTLPDARPRGGRGRDARRPQPARASSTSRCARRSCARGRCPTTPPTSATSPASSWPTRLAHQWWGQGTAPANYRERWLSEAWAQYAAALWMRERLGRGGLPQHDGPDGRLGDSLRRVRAHPPRPAARARSRQDARVFRAVVYDKGAWVLHMLRGIVGDEAFFAGARAFLERFRFAKVGHRGPPGGPRGGERARPAPLLRAVDLRDRPARAPLVLPDGEEPTEASARRSTFGRRACPGPLPLQLAATTAAGSEVLPVVVGTEGGSWTIETRQEPRRVTLNDDRGLLARVERVARLAPPQR